MGLCHQRIQMLEDRNSEENKEQDADTPATGTIVALHDDDEQGVPFTASSCHHGVSGPAKNFTQVETKRNLQGV